ncbi:protein D2-like [Paramacrobiotus metropolitanus]|uniref:protein D2-like n=1 Tax=Paramacrobiotus metropolitanus TaxID=2943436 RepID=UPI0024458C2E|nr:protein D2-like [Paramacrobiotus metropolitanus]
MAHQDAGKKFEESGLVPDILDSPPGEALKVSYPSGVAPEFGNELTPRQVKDQPTVTWNAKDGELYTLHMSDPDAPNRQNPEVGPINHWLVVNIPGGNIQAGQTITEYRGSRPRQNSGLHRYAFMVFRQTGSITVDNPDLAENRRKFPIRDFAKQHNLGQPIAGNFYVAQFDDYVASVI